MVIFKDYLNLTALLPLLLQSLPVPVNIREYTVRLLHIRVNLPVLVFLVYLSDADWLQIPALAGDTNKHQGQQAKVHSRICLKE